jgi:hypothetical protein
MRILPPFFFGHFSLGGQCTTFGAVRQNSPGWLTVATPTRFHGTILLVSDRGERRFLWFLTLVVGLAVCVFSFSGHQSMARLVVLPLGIFLAVWAWVRLRRLSRRRSRHERVE